MADDVEYAHGADQTTTQGTGQTTAKSSRFVTCSPNIEIIKSVQGVIELLLRGGGIVSSIH